MENTLTEEQAIAETIALLSHYGFELEGAVAEDVIAQWQTQHPAAWLRAAVLESLYRGRYKKISVEEILRVWAKWGEPKLNFNSEFVALICAKLNCQTMSLLPPETLVPQESRADLAITIIPPDSNPEPHTKTDGIERFHPQSDREGSDAYQKLKAIATQPKSPEVEADNKKPQ